MKRTTKQAYSPSSEEMELCSCCGGEGTYLSRGYQQTMDEAITVRCSTCNGTGERPKGTKAKEKEKQRLNQISFLLKRRDEAQKALDKLGYYDL